MPTVRVGLTSRGEPMMLSHLTLALVSCALSSFLFGCLSQKSVTQPVAVLTEEQMAVYRGFLEALSATGFKNLSTSTIALEPSDLKPSSPCLQGLKLENPSGTGTSSHQLGPEIVRGLKLELVDSRQQAALIESADNAARQPAGESRERTPSAALEHGFLVLSEIGFDKAHQFAVLKYNFVCGTHCLTSQTYVLAKTDDGWKLKGRPCAMAAY